MRAMQFKNCCPVCRKPALIRLFAASYCDLVVKTLAVLIINAVSAR